MMGVLTVTLFVVVVIKVTTEIRNASQSDGTSNVPIYLIPPTKDPTSDNGPPSVFDIISQYYGFGVAMLFIAWGASFHTLSHLIRLHYDVSDGGAPLNESGGMGLMDRRVTMAGTSGIEEVDVRFYRARARAATATISADQHRFSSDSNNNNNNDARRLPLTVRYSWLCHIIWIWTSLLNAVGLAGVMPGTNVWRTANGGRNLKWFGKWSDGEPDFGDVAVEVRNAEERASDGRTPSTSVSTSSTPHHHKRSSKNIQNDIKVIRLPMATSKSLYTIRNQLQQSSSSSSTNLTESEPLWTVADVGGVCVLVPSEDLENKEFQEKLKKQQEQQRRQAAPFSTFSESMNLPVSEQDIYDHANSRNRSRSRGENGHVAGTSNSEENGGNGEESSARRGGGVALWDMGRRNRADTQDSEEGVEMSVLSSQLRRRETEVIKEEELDEETLKLILGY
jgi:hypothetical protein